MKKKRLLKIVALACSLTCAASASVGVASWIGSINEAKAYEIVLDSANDLQSEYAYGTSISIPAGTIQGAKTTRSVVISPSGKVYKEANVILSEAGKYSVVWYAKVNGKEVSAEKEFVVTESVFSTSGDVKCQYVETLEKMPGAKDEDGNVTIEKKDGVKISLQPESTFRYNKAIDLTDSSNPFAHIFPYHGITNTKEALDEEAVLDAPLNEYNKKFKEEKKNNPDMTDAEIIKKLGEAPKDYSPEYKWHEEARNYLITLTDCYDSTNSVTIDLEWQEGRNYWNFRAGAVGQTAHGLRSKITETSTVAMVGDVAYAYHFAPGQGTTSCNVMDNYGLKLYYDVEENELFITFCRYTADKGYVINEKIMVADLDNTTIYPKNAFKGFTTGEVYFSMTAKNYVGNVANVDIASLGGVSGEDILKVDMHDTKAPTIEINEALRKGKTFIALNEEVQVPTALAHDLSLPYGTKATMAVYYNYNPNSDKNVLVSLSHGKFTPTKKGVYTVVYTATDRSGLVKTETVELQCVAGVNGKAVNLSVDEEMQEYAGALINIPECVIDGLYTDRTLLKTYLQFEDGEKVLYEADTLFLEGVGRYVLTYVYETPFKTYTTTSVINASASDNVALKAPAVPEYFIKGATYTLDDALAYEYTAKEPVEVVATTYMSEDGGEYVEINNREFEISASETVRFKYEHNGEVKYSETIKVVDVDFLGSNHSMEKYFHSEEDVITAIAHEAGVKYVTNGTVKNATLKYINVLSLDAFSIDFTLLSGEEGQVNKYVAPEAITFTLVDYYDRSNKVTLRFTNGVGGVVLSVNGVEKTTSVASFLDKKISVSYDNGFVLEGTTYLWDGAFVSDRMLLSVSLEGMKGSSCLNVSRLNDEKLTDRKKDNAEPILFTSKINEGYQPFNTIITITPAIACDIMSPYVESGLTLTVSKPDGEYATSLDGVVLDGTCPIDRAYQIKLDEIGVYFVSYDYMDQNGDYASLTYNPTVRDEEAPVLTVEGVSENQVVKATWGTYVQVANYSAYDNISEGEGLDAWACVIYPSNIMRELDNGVFYAEEKGDYTVLYNAYDEEGNFATFAYVVRVS